ncbi:MAG: hypothetical protein P8Y48_14945 [Novosphingobium sp.]
MEMTITKACGHASASRAQVPDPAIVELPQAERPVECFEADFWAGSGAEFACNGMDADAGYVARLF